MGILGCAISKVSMGACRLACILVACRFRQGARVVKWTTWIVFMSCTDDEKTSLSHFKTLGPFIHQSFAFVRCSSNIYSGF